MIEWKYQGREVLEDFASEDYYGFIYCIYYEDGSLYVGKKSFWKTVKLKPRKTDRKNANRTEIRESDWRKYNGSCKLSKDKVIASKEILQLCNTKIDLTYWEMAYMVNYGVLFNPQFLNQNVLGKFYAGQLTGSKEYIKEVK